MITRLVSERVVSGYEVRFGEIVPHKHILNYV